MLDLTQKQKDSFWDKVKILYPDQCWEWQAYRSKFANKPGIVSFNSNFYLAHRVPTYSQKDRYKTMYYIRVAILYAVIQIICMRVLFEI